MKSLFNFILYTLLLVMCLTLVGCGKKADFSIQPGSTILAFGDSLTYGYGASKGKSWPESFSNISGYTVINSGVNGNTTQQGLERIEEDLEEYKPQLVVLSLGGNDFLRQQSAQAAKTNLVGIISKIKKSGAHVVLVAQPAPSLAAAAFSSLSDHTLYSEIEKEQGVYVVHSAWSSILSKADLKSDLIHANDKGYELFAQNLYESLQKAKIIDS